jgi:hypothetical protein
MLSLQFDLIFFPLVLSPMFVGALEDATAAYSEGLSR